MTSARQMIPVNEPLISERAVEYVARAARSGWISSEGPYVKDFEEQWAAYCGMPYGVAVCNGTAALELAVSCAGLKPGDEVIVPTFTIISCILAILEAKAVPVLVDCDPATWCMDVEQAASRVTSRTKAIMPVHIYGHPVDMDPVLELARRRELTVIEDAAEAHGAEYRGRRVGSFGDMSCFSFYANKIVTTGEGGMVLARDIGTTERLRSGRNLGFRSDRRFLHTELGHNYRLTSLQAALGVAQVEAMDEHVTRKRRMGANYTTKLSRHSELQLPVERPWATNVYWMYGVVLDERSRYDANTFAAALRARGVDTRPFFLGMHEQPVLQAMGLFRDESYPNAERCARRGLYLPSGLALTQEQQDIVCDAVADVLAA